MRSNVPLASDRLKVARRKRNFTQRELARHLAVTATTVARWEQGRARPRRKHAERLADVLSGPEAPGPFTPGRASPPRRVRVAARRIAAALETFAVSGFSPRPRARRP